MLPSTKEVEIHKHYAAFNTIVSPVTKLEEILSYTDIWPPWNWYNNVHLWYSYWLHPRDSTVLKITNSNDWVSNAGQLSFLISALDSSYFQPSSHLTWIHIGGQRQAAICLETQSKKFLHVKEKQWIPRKMLNPNTAANDMYISVENVTQKMK